MDKCCKKAIIIKPFFTKHIIIMVIFNNMKKNNSNTPKKIKCHKGEIYKIGFNCSGYQPGEYVIYINVNGKTNSKKIHIK